MITVISSKNYGVFTTLSATVRTEGEEKPFRRYILGLPGLLELFVGKYPPNLEKEIHDMTNDDKRRLFVQNGLYITPWTTHYYGLNIELMGINFGIGSPIPPLLQFTIPSDWRAERRAYLKQ